MCVCMCGYPCKNVSVCVSVYLCVYMSVLGALEAGSTAVVIDPPGAERAFAIGSESHTHPRVGVLSMC